MLNFWEQLGVSIFLGVLHGLKIDPSRVPALKDTLVAIMNACAELLGVQPPTVP